MHSYKRKDSYYKRKYNFVSYEKTQCIQLFLKEKKDKKSIQIKSYVSEDQENMQNLGFKISKTTNEKHALIIQNTAHLSPSQEVELTT